MRTVGPGANSLRGAKPARGRACRPEKRPRHCVFATVYRTGIGPGTLNLLQEEQIVAARLLPQDKGPRGEEDERCSVRNDTPKTAVVATISGPERRRRCRRNCARVAVIEPRRRFGRKRRDCRSAVDAPNTHSSGGRHDLPWRSVAWIRRISIFFLPESLSTTVFEPTRLVRLPCNAAHKALVSRGPFRLRGR